MGDDELAAIRAKRMAELQAMGGGGGGAGGGAEKQREQMEQRKAQMEDMKNSILSQVLDQEARGRLNTLMIAKPEKGKQVEAMLCQMAQTGQLASKLGEKDLKELLERFNAGSASNTKVKFDRRRAALDSDDE